ncbi:MAG: ATP-binding protein [Planctomycetaceae bacterium]|nr:ATP-binding protein [Planctomycetaceae bacterium]
MFALALIFVILFAVYIVIHVFDANINNWFCRRYFYPHTYVKDTLRRHFGSIEPDDMYIVSRSFQKMMQIELYREIQKFLKGKVIVRKGAIELYNDNRLNDCLTTNNREFEAVKYIELDIGEEKPVRCLDNVLYLWREGQIPMALLLISSGSPPMMHVDIAVPKKYRTGPEIEQIMNRLENAIKDCESYRHKIISFESRERYSDCAHDIKVHRLSSVSREQLILPEKTIDLLDRNLLNFVEKRQQLKERGLSAKKGILFYGPPGTGKTHTLHYVIGQLKKEYTTFLVTAEQVANLGMYCSLARLIEPAIIVLEDVDLIARERGAAACEPALNKLLNEMDGLKEDADLIFILTTNRPDDLEDAIRNRPGRIDQAIEFPKPDKAGLIKLAQLYSSGFELSEEDAAAIAVRTEGASAAFIKELLRRSAQFLLERDEKAVKFETSDWKNALREMLTGSTFGVLAIGEADKFVL